MILSTISVILKLNRWWKALVHSLTVLEYDYCEKLRRKDDDHDERVRRRPERIMAYSFAQISNMIGLTIPNSTISSMNSWSRPWIASRMVFSVSCGINVNGKQATSFGWFSQSESATQWILAKMQYSIVWKIFSKSIFHSHLLLAPCISPLPRPHWNRWYHSNQDLPSALRLHPQDTALFRALCNLTI